jgi:hypothetical protein
VRRLPQVLTWSICLLFVAFTPDVRIAGAEPPSAPYRLVSPQGGGTRVTISADGRSVLLVTVAGLVPGDTDEATDAYIFDERTDSYDLVTPAAASAVSSNTAMSRNGRWVAYTETVSQSPLYLYDRVTNATVVAGTAPELQQGPEVMDVADDGSVVFLNGDGGRIPPNFVYLWLYRPGQGYGPVPNPTVDGLACSWGARRAAISADGSRVAAPLRCPGSFPSSGEQYGLIDVATGSTRIISKSATGELANNNVAGSSLSADGTVVAFASSASNLVPGVTPPHPDSFNVFLWTEETEAVTSIGSGLGSSFVSTTSVSYDGAKIGFLDPAADLDPSPLPGLVSSAYRTMYVFSRSDGTYRNATGAAVGLSPQFFSLAASTGRAAFLSFLQLTPDDTNSDSDVYLETAVSDQTPPVVTGATDRPPDAAGWFNHPTTISWSSTDPEPSSGIPTIPTQSFAAVEGAAVTFTSGASCDPSGNCATGALTIALDFTAPSVTLSGVTDGAVYSIGTVISPACSTNDTLSGVATPATLSVTGGNPDGTGQYTATCSGASDVADNHGPVVQATWQLHYTTTGLGDGSVKASPIVNEGKAGRTYSFRWKLIGAGGEPVADLAAVSGITFQTTACSTFTGPGDPITAESPGAAGLTVDQDGVYKFNWATPSAAGCYRVTIAMRDGSTLVADFDLR